jgi:DNA-directed RNA polymerase specialized sigma subunit
MDEIRVMMPGSRRFKTVQLEPLAAEHQDLPSLEDKEGLLFLQGVLNRILDGRKQAILYRSLVLGDTLQQIGRDMGITESRVSQLRTESLMKIRGGLNA